MKLKFLLAFVATFVVGSFQTLAAITDLSFGSVEKVVSHQVRNTDYLSYSINYNDDMGWKWVGNVDSHRHTAGQVETINQLGRRSQEEFVASMEETSRFLVSKILADSSLTEKVDGKTFRILCSGNKFGSTGLTIMVYQDFTPQRVNGLLQVNEEAYRVDLVEAIRSRYHISIFVPKISKAFLEVEDEDGLHRIDGTILDEYGNDGGMQYRAKEERIIIRTHWLFELRKGSIRISYTGGQEELISLSDWKPLITYLSPPASAPFRRSGLPFLTKEGTFALPYEAESWRVVNVEKSSTPWDANSWTATSGVTFLPVATPASTGSGAVSIQTAILPIEGEFVVYRLRDGEPVAPQRR